MSKTLQQRIQAQDWRYNCAGRDWRDGLLLGNGKLGAVAAAPAHLEWVLNQVNIFDPTVEQAALARRVPHADFLRMIADKQPKNTLFLNQVEGVPGLTSTIRKTLSAAVLRLRFWRGIDWSSPAIPLTRQHLSLYDGTLDETMTAHNFNVKLRMFIPRHTTLFCLRITENSPQTHPHIFELLRPINEQLKSPIFQQCTDQTFVIFQQLPGGRASYAVAMSFAPHQHNFSAHLSANFANGMEITQTGDTAVFISVKSSFECADPVAAAVAETQWGSEQTFDQLEKMNGEWWHNWWQQGAYADFGRYRELQKYYTFSLYELACAFGGSPMPGLNGLAYGPLDEHTPGVGSQGYTHDQNAQIPALAFFPTHHVELLESLIDTYWNVRQTLRRETRKLFNCPGIFLPLTMNQLGLEYPTRAYRYTLCGSAYTGMVLAWGWRYSRDIKLLKDKIYPLLRELVIFYVSLMQLGADGRYHLTWSVPPEIFTLTRDDNATLAMLKVALETLLETSQLLHRNRRQRALWQKILQHYPPLCHTPDGAYWCGPDVPLNHYFFGGHLLYPFFPSGLETNLKSARQTLKLIETQAVERSFADFKDHWHPNHEWSMFLITGTQLRCGDRVKGWQGIMRYLELFAKENGLFSHDPILIGDPAESAANEKRHQKELASQRCFSDGQMLTLNHPEVPHPLCVTPNPNAKRLAPGVLEGNSALLVLASEALLQSHGGVLRLFPGVPPDFTGGFRNFLAQGGYTVDATMRRGTLLQATIHSPVDTVVQVQLPTGQNISVKLTANQSTTLK